MPVDMKKDFCQYCSKEYTPKIWNKVKSFVGAIEYGSSHNCKMQKDYFKAVNKRFGIKTV
jgi:hypothetical protein